ncbi:formyltransferase family protein [Sphingobium estronivorans]|uniref:formyltransferase family protein n=1 Tax=Sphingobium estronivorans TaxID=1577690 RepID=UPI00123A986A|nr:formyltransferase family protein [Sphingobium estronivorans]
MSMKRALLIGAVETTRIAFDAIIRHPGWEVAAVVTLDPALAGRHSDFVDLAPAARDRGCPVIHVDNINREEALAALRGAGADMAFVMGWSQICGAAFRDLFPDRVVGYHPAALPRLRGRAAIPWTILQQEPITAGTLFWIDAGTDTGAILDQQYFHVAPLETAASLYAKHMEALAVMLDRSLERLAAGDEPRRMQDESCATWAARRTPADGRIDWRQPAEDVLRLIRAAGHPYPGAFTRMNGADLQIWAAALSDIGRRHAARPGQVILRTAESFTVMCGHDSALTVSQWSGADKPPRLHIALGE